MIGKPSRPVRREAARKKDPHTAGTSPDGLPNPSNEQVIDEPAIGRPVPVQASEVAPPTISV